MCCRPSWNYNRIVIIGLNTSDVFITSKMSLKIYNIHKACKNETNSRNEMFLFCIFITRMVNTRAQPTLRSRPVHIQKTIWLHLVDIVIMELLFTNLYVITSLCFNTSTVRSRSLYKFDQLWQLASKWVKSKNNCFFTEYTIFFFTKFNT